MRKSSIGFQDLPKTLQDAAMVVRFLGLRYVWIDCLAIVQDDTADWEKESAVMADIYSGSYINIAASNASHCGAGFLGPRKMPMTERIEIHDSEGDLEVYLVAQQTRNYALPSDPLETRAWVLQEQLLPSRSLHFGSANMFWRCPDGISHEEQRRGWTHLYTLDAVVYSINLPIGAAIGLDAWFQLVRDYTARGITYHKDKFPAISGVMTVLQRMTGDVCAAGLWKRNFAKWLLVVPKGLNPLGELKDGWAKISGSVTDVTAIGKDVATGKSPYRSCKVQMRDQSYRDARVLFDVEAYEACEVLIVAPALGVAIISTDKEQGEYVRVGLVVIKRVKSEVKKDQSKEWYPEAEDYSEPRSIVLR
ncbi:uncharacterized protein J4E88_003260 [Alternaria novae-zelandiae]|uniref:uncharacterized protein n=1 Tax=Alternaria novae-zelandiae TaxID=430562 RepID=UPI0020C557A2|nr:uncharacterized protein J4E88_003260 [Alternaria novae-zelandiae]KAI4687669.1 hypothetical protein J4E88_003260 [Alternaria novae-zelandiae]